MNERAIKEMARLLYRQQRLETEVGELRASIRELEVQLSAGGSTRLETGTVDATPWVTSAAPVLTGAAPMAPGLMEAVPQELPVLEPLPLALALHAATNEAPPVLTGAVEVGGEVGARMARETSAAGFVGVEGKTTAVRSMDEVEGAWAGGQERAASRLAGGMEGEGVEEPEIRASDSFEMKLGTYWFVRIGVVMLLTGLVFLGNHAYQYFSGRLGPLFKLGMLYAASGALIGLGVWLPRRHATLRQYGQILFGGGLAAVYFTTYAAHHIERLRVIQSPVLDGFLLMAWAGFVVWLADRRKSEVLALFALGLAYYTSVITSGGVFTLFSNLVLTVAAVAFLVRHRWMVVSNLSLLATYAAYAYWRFYASGAGDAVEARALWVENGFLAGYWVAFTAAVFAGRAERFEGGPRATFMTANNAACFALVMVNTLAVYRESFWVLALGFGVLCLGLAAALRRWLSEDRVCRQAALAQGLLLVTVGVIAKLSGHQLALVLGAEAVALLVIGTLVRNRLLTGASYVVALLATLHGVEPIASQTVSGLALGVALVGFMGFNSWWVARFPGETVEWERETEQTEAEARTAGAMAEEEAETNPAPLQVGALAYAFLAIGLLWLTTQRHTTGVATGPVLAVEALGLMLLLWVIRARELAVVGQLLLPAALAAWFTNREPGIHPPWWSAMGVGGCALALAHGWQRAGAVRVERSVAMLFESVGALGAMLMVHEWLRPHFGVAAWSALAGGLCLVATAYGVWTGLASLVMAAQILVVSAVLHFMRALGLEDSDELLTLCPVATTLMLGLGAARVVARAGGMGYADLLCGVGQVYRGLACLMMLVWVGNCVPAQERFWVFVVVSWLPVVWFAWRGGVEALAGAAVFLAAGAISYLLGSEGGAAMYGPHLLAILGVFGAQQLVRRRAPHVGAVEESVHAAWAATAGVLLWVFTTRAIQAEAGGFYLTVGWSGLGFVLLAAGLILQERAYRWLALVVLGLALVRVVLFDVWKLATVYRILSFMALGIVLLALGYIYNRYQDRIRRWL